GKKTVLHVAALNNRKEVAKLLIFNCPNVNEKNKYGKTALHYATSNKSK
ncbi:hypothetical protein TVAG_329140, partial [Trichomonas vaginalis G3]